jgi:hypothetical protein
MTGVVDTGGKFLAGVLMLEVNLPLVSTALTVHLKL